MEKLPRIIQRALIETEFSFLLLMILIIIIIIIRHELGLHRPVLASSNCLFKGLPSRLVHLVYNSALFLHPVVVRSCYMS